MALLTYLIGNRTMVLWFYSNAIFNPECALSYKWTYLLTYLLTYSVTEV